MTVQKEKSFMAFMLFDPNPGGKVSLLFHCHLTERLVNFALVFLYSLQMASHLLTQLSVSALSSVALAFCTPVRLKYLKQRWRSLPVINQRLHSVQGKSKLLGMMRSTHLILPTVWTDGSCVTSGASLNASEQEPHKSPLLYLCFCLYCWCIPDALYLTILIFELL